MPSGKPRTDPAALAGGFLSETFPDAKAALEGARDILAEGLAEDAALLGRLRDHMRKVGRLVAKVVEGKEQAGAKFSDYFAHAEPFAGAPSHRVLAMLRGRNEEVLSLDLEVDAEAPRGESPAERACGAALGAGGRGPRRPLAARGGGLGLGVKLRTSLTLDLMAELREGAEAEAIRVFARNLKDLLLAAPAGGRRRWALTRHPHGREGRGGGCDGQASGDRHGLSLPAEERPEGRAGGHCPADRAERG